MQMISAINAELAKIGYRAVKLPRSNRLTVRTSFEPVDRLTVWNPQTKGGRACKAAMLRWSKWPKPHVSLLPDLLALFGYGLQDVQPWPHCHKGNYGPALVNALHSEPKLLTDYGRMADGSPVNVVFGQAIGPLTKIFCTK